MESRLLASFLLWLVVCLHTKLQRMSVDGVGLEPWMTLARFQTLLAERTGVYPTAQEIFLGSPPEALPVRARREVVVLHGEDEDPNPVLLSRLI